MNNRLLVALAILASIALSIPTARAQNLLLSWDIAGKNSGTNSNLAGTVQSALTSGGNMTLGTGLSTVNTDNSFRGTPFNQTSLSNAIANNQYLQLTLTPTEAISITQLVFTISTATSGAFSYNLFTSATGFAAANSLYQGTNNSVANTATTNTVDLTGIPALQNINSELTFRVYGYRAGAGTTTFGFANGVSTDDVGIYGQAIPEPSTYVLLAVGLVILVLAARRKMTSRRTRA